MDWLRSSRNALLTVSIILLALIYPTMYWILIGGNGWAVLLWDFLAVLPVGVMQVYIRDLLPASVRSTGAGLGYNGGTWLAAWAAIIATLMAGAATKPQPWLPSITINTAIGAILMIISFALSAIAAKQSKDQ